MHYNKNRHSCYKLSYHLVVVTKYRHKVIDEAIKKRLIAIFTEILEERWGCQLIEINTDEDHLHVLFDAPPQVQLSKLVNNLKTVSSRLIRKEFSAQLAPYYWKPYFWSNSYLILSTGGATIDMIKKYIENQGQ
ncbi:MAG: IS200/IS605 family transposase [Culicoidibacterales bacterium]